MRLNVFDNLMLDEALVAIILIAGGFLVARLLYYMFEKVFTKIASKTETTLDDDLVRGMRAPFNALVIFGGLYYGLTAMTSLDSYQQIINTSSWVIAAVLITWTVKRAITIVIDWYSREIAIKTASKLDDTIYPILRKVISIALYVMAFLIILDHFNVEISPLLASLGVASLAVALALQDTLSNFFSGMYMIADKPVKVGDLIRLENAEEGEVVKIGWRSTWIKKLNNNILILPNTKLANSTILNYDLPEKPMTITLLCGVSYESDLEEVQKIAYDVAVKVRDSEPGTVKSFDPLVRFFNFGPSNVEFKIILEISGFQEQWIIVNNLIKSLHKAFAKKKIDINYPAASVYFKTSIPK